MTLKQQTPSLKASLTLDINGYDSSDGEGQAPPEVTQPQVQFVRGEGGSFRIENSIVIESVAVEPVEVRQIAIHDFRIIQSLSAGLVPPTISFKPNYRALANELCQKHKAICVNERVFGGMPHIKGLRVSVPNVLTHLYHLGSIDAVVAEFEQRLSKEQVKEAIAYAHDFMEMACDPSEGDD